MHIFKSKFSLCFSYQLLKLELSQTTAPRKSSSAWTPKWTPWKSIAKMSSRETYKVRGMAAFRIPKTCRETSLCDSEENVPSGLLSTGSVTLMLLSSGPAPCCSKVINEARSVERKVCFILDASDWGGGSQHPNLSKGQQAPPQKPGCWSFYRQRDRATCRSSTVAQTVILKLVTGGQS